MSRRFRFLPGFTLLVAALLAATVNLGFWQLRRADEKRALAAQMAARAASAPLPLATALALADPQFQPVQVQGRFLTDSEGWLATTLANGQRGRYRLVWLRTETGQALLVNRGFEPLPAAAGRAEFDNAVLPDTPVELLGDLYAPTRPWRAAPPPPSGQSPIEWPVFDFQAMQTAFATLPEATGLNVVPFVLRLSPEAAHGFVREWPAFTGSPEKHTGYAVQWFALSAALTGLYLWFSFRKRPQ